MSHRSTPRRFSRFRRLLFLLPLLLTAALVSPAGVPDALAQNKKTGTYTNPLKPTSPVGIVESCADPTVIKGQEGDPYWYMYCTTDPLNDNDRVVGGDLNFHLIPTFRSLDLVNWEYVNDAFSRDPNSPRAMPTWAEPSAAFWAPEIDYFNGKYYLYYGVTDVKASVSGEANCPFDRAIGVATSESPTGPWEDKGVVVTPRRGGGGCNFYWFFDSDVIEAEDGNKYIYYGSYYGGIYVSQLTDDGLKVVPNTEEPVTIPNRYEGAEVVYRNGYYYLFVSATDCCRSSLTGYSVFVGRSKSPTGPFVDREGVSFLDSRVGGTPFLSMNGNEWVGTGHNTVFQDFSGQWWTIYHALNRFDPMFDDPNPHQVTKRPALLDPVTWRGGWPSVRGGLWASNTPQPAPAAQPGQKAHVNDHLQREDQPHKLIYAEEFNDPTLGTEWTWERPPATGTYGFTAEGTLRFDTQAADLYQGNNSASVLLLSLPQLAVDYVVETRVKLDLPAEGCCYNFRQAGIVIYGSDDAYIKLVHASIWETRQTEFAKEQPTPVPIIDPGRNRYGNTVVGPPADWTLLRIVKRTFGNEEHYTAYTRRDVPGSEWVRGGTWTHRLGSNVKIGLVSMGRGGPEDSPIETRAFFDYVRVYSVKPAKAKD